MAVYQELSLSNFRSYQKDVFGFGESVTIIVGPNGSGKTNLLEALYVLSTGGSFRAADRDLVRRGQAGFRLEARYGEQQRRLAYHLSADGTTFEKQFEIDATKRARLGHEQRLPVVLFEPTHLKILLEAPSLRRDYLDSLLVRVQPDYAWLHHQFERVLVQRNAVLRRHLSSLQLQEQLFGWDVKFVQLAEQLVGRRQALTDRLAAEIGALYSTIANRPQVVGVTYQRSVAAIDYQAGLLKQLQADLPRDVQRGFTGRGPQRDDLIISLNGAPAAVAASRGELRSLLLALTLFELSMVEEVTQNSPLLLLDDVFSELDATRRRMLASLAKDYQTIITTTDADAIVEHFGIEHQVIKTKQK